MLLLLFLHLGTFWLVNHVDRQGKLSFDDEMKKLALQYVAAYDGGEMKKVLIQKIKQ